MNSCRNVVSIVLALLLVMPSRADDSEATFRELFGDELKKVNATRSTDDDVAFAGKLMAHAESLASDEPILTLFYEQVFELGSRTSSGYDVALEAMDQLIERVPEQADKAREKKLILWQSAYRKARGERRPVFGEYLVGGLNEKGKRQIATGQFTEAQKTYQNASATARANRLPIAKLMKSRMDQARELATVQKRVEMLKKRLLADPESDRDAGREVVMAYLVKFNQPGAAGEYAFLVDDETRIRIGLASRPIDSLSADECANLGVWYAELAKPERGLIKLAAFERAEAYLMRCVEESDGKTPKPFEVVKAELLLKNIQEQIDDLRKALGLGQQWLDLAAAFKRNLKEKSKYKAKRGYLNGVFSVKANGYGAILTDFKPKPVIYSVEIRRISGEVKMEVQNTEKMASYFTPIIGGGAASLARWTRKSGAESLVGLTNLNADKEFVELQLAIMPGAQVLFADGKEVARSSDGAYQIPGRVVMSVQNGHALYRQPRLRFLTPGEIARLKRGESK